MWYCGSQIVNAGTDCGATSDSSGAWQLLFLSFVNAVESRDGAIGCWIIRTERWLFNKKEVNVACDDQAQDIAAFIQTGIKRH